MKALDATLALASSVLAIAQCWQGRRIQSIPWWLGCVGSLGIARVRFLRNS